MNADEDESGDLAIGILKLKSPIQDEHGEERLGTRDAQGRVPQPSRVFLSLSIQAAALSSRAFAFCERAGFHDASFSFFLTHSAFGYVCAYGSAE